MISRMYKAASVGALAAAAHCGTDATPAATTPAKDATTETERNKIAVQQSFERWRSGSGSPFELLAADAKWTIVGSSPLSRTYTRAEFLATVIAPFNARMRTPLVPTVRGLYGDGDMVITHFDASATAKDGQPYENSYTWYFRMKAGAVTDAVAFFDTRRFDDLWVRVVPDDASRSTSIPGSR